MTRDLAFVEFSAADAAAHLPELGALLHACVETGAGVNFVLPFSAAESEAYWSEAVLPKLRDGSALLFVAKDGNRIAGSVRLDPVWMPNQPHRAEVSKLLVHPEFRRRGIATRLMQELERCASGLGRTLLTLDTRTGDPSEAFYTQLGYVTVGTVPDYALDTFGSGRFDPTTIMYKKLAPAPPSEPAAIGDGETALILCSHGVDGTPGAAAEHAVRLRERAIFADVSAACLSGEPEIRAAVDAAAAPRIVVVPFLMAAGRAFRTLLPERLAGARRREAVALAEPVGTQPGIAALIAAKASALADARGWPVREVLLVIAAHGTARDPESGIAAREHAARVARDGRFAGVEAGYLDEPPSIEGLLAGRATRHAIGVGLFADAGPHGGDDAGQPFAADPDTAYAGPIGPDPDLTDIVLKSAQGPVSAVSSSD